MDLKKPDEDYNRHDARYYDIGDKALLSGLVFLVTSLFIKNYIISIALVATTIVLLTVKFISTSKQVLVNYKREMTIRLGCLVGVSDIKNFATTSGTKIQYKENYNTVPVTLLRINNETHCNRLACFNCHKEINIVAWSNAHIISNLFMYYIGTVFCSFYTWIAIRVFFNFPIMEYFQSIYTANSILRIICIAPVGIIVLVLFIGSISNSSKNDIGFMFAVADNTHKLFAVKKEESQINVSGIKDAESAETNRWN